MAKEKTQTMTKFTGKRGWLIFWIIAFWPIAIYYYVTNRNPVNVKVKNE